MGQQSSTASKSNSAKPNVEDTGDALEEIFGCCVQEKSRRTRVVPAEISGVQHSKKNDLKDEAEIARFIEQAHLVLNSEDQLKQDACALEMCKMSSENRNEVLKKSPKRMELARMARLLHKKVQAMSTNEQERFFSPFSLVEKTRILVALDSSDEMVRFANRITPAHISKNAKGSSYKNIHEPEPVRGMKIYKFSQEAGGLKNGSRRGSTFSDSGSRRGSGVFDSNGSRRGSGVFDSKDTSFDQGESGTGGVRRASVDENLGMKRSGSREHLGGTSGSFRRRSSMDGESFSNNTLKRSGSRENLTQTSSVTTGGANQSPRNERRASVSRGSGPSSPLAVRAMTIRAGGGTGLSEISGVGDTRAKIQESDYDK